MEACRQGGPCALVWAGGTGGAAWWRGCAGGAPRGGAGSWPHLGGGDFGGGGDLHTRVANQHSRMLIQFPSQRFKQHSAAQQLMIVTAGLEQEAVPWVPAASKVMLAGGDLLGREASMLAHLGAHAPVVLGTPHSAVMLFRTPVRMEFDPRESAQRRGLTPSLTVPAGQLRVRFVSAPGRPAPRTKRETCTAGLVKRTPGWCGRHRVAAGGRAPIRLLVYRGTTSRAPPCPCRAHLRLPAVCRPPCPRPSRTGWTGRRSRRPMECTAEEQGGESSVGWQQYAGRQPGEPARRLRCAAA